MAKKNRRQAVLTVLVIAAVLVSVVFLVGRFTKKDIEEVAEDEMLYAGEDAEGQHWYFVLKEEVRDWVGIAGSAVPVLALVFAYFFKKKE